jgi:hydrogenase maturation protease
MTADAVVMQHDSKVIACVVGLGGDFGDDRVGWRVIERLHESLAGSAPQIELKRLSDPAGLLGLMQGQQMLIVVDACQGLSSPGSIFSARWPDFPLARTRHQFGHHVTIDVALSLAANLGTLPATCDLWCIEGRCFEFGQPLSPEVELAADSVAAEIRRRLELN